eukprot:UN13785
MYGCPKHELCDHDKTQFPSNFGDELKAKYIQNTDNEHISLIIFDHALDANDDIYDEGHFIIETPHDDDGDGDTVIHIYIDENNMIRLESKKW